MDKNRVDPMQELEEVGAMSSLQLLDDGLMSPKGATLTTMLHPKPADESEAELTVPKQHQHSMVTSQPVRMGETADKDVLNSFNVDSSTTENQQLLNK